MSTTHVASGKRPGGTHQVSGASQPLWVRGAISGLCGATVLALWFLIVDSAQGDPFRVPALLANGLFGIDGLEGSPGTIVVVTLIHFAAFIGIGIAVTWLSTHVDWVPSTLLGVALGFALFDVLAFSSVSVTGIDVIQELGWLEVLSGNVLAGLTMMAYLHLTGTIKPTPWWRLIAAQAIVREGVVAGLLAALTISAWFLAADLMQGRPFFTPAALGSALFLGASEIAQVEVTFWTVAAYSLLHFGAFVAVGLVASAIAGQVESMPPIVRGLVLLLVVFEAFSLGFFAVIAEWVLATVAFWSIGAANLIAVTVMAYYLWRRHPELRIALIEEPLD